MFLLNINQVFFANQSKYPLSFEASLSKDEKFLQLTLVAKDIISSKGKSMEILKNVEIALSEIVNDSSISFLDNEVTHHELRPIPPQHDTSEKNLTASEDGPETAFNWSETACSIRNEIALLAGCESTELNAQTSIFALGLDSIDVIKLSSRLKRRAVHMPVSVIMRNATIYQMSQASEDLLAVDEDPPKLRLETCVSHLSAYLQKSGLSMDSFEAVLPPTPFQEAIFADTSTTSFARYLNQEVFIVRSSVDIKKLELAWKSVIEQSPILRTSCVAIDDPDIPFSYAQIVHRPGPSCTRHVVKKPSDSMDASVETVMQHDRIMALDHVPFGITFLHHMDTCHIVLTLSHALYDGTSLSLLHGDILDAYHDRFSSRPSYRDTLGHILSSSDAQAARYWTEYISGAKPCSFLSRIEKPLSQSQVVRLESLSSIPAVDVRSFVKSQGISIQALGQICWSLLLGYYLKTLEVTFGVMLSGRDTEQANEIMFPTMNTIVVRTVIGGSLRQMLHDMQESCANAVQHQHFPLRKSLAVVEKEGRKLFDSLFIVQKKAMAISDDKRLYDPVGGKSSVEVMHTTITGIHMY